MFTWIYYAWGGPFMQHHFVIFQGTPKIPSSCRSRHPGLRTGMQRTLGVGCDAIVVSWTSFYAQAADFMTHTHIPSNSLRKGTTYTHGMQTPREVYEYLEYPASQMPPTCLPHGHPHLLPDVSHRHPILPEVSQCFQMASRCLPCADASQS